MTNNKTWTGFKTFQRLKSIKTEYLEQQKKIEAEIDKIATDGRYTKQAKNEMIAEKRERLDAQRRAAALNIDALREFYFSELETKSPVSISENKVSGGKTITMLTNDEITLLKSLEYVHLDGDGWQRIAQNIDADVTPAFALAVRDAAKKAGYEIKGLVTDKQDLMQEFDTLAGMTAKQIERYADHNPDAKWLDVNVSGRVDAAIEKYSLVSDDGTIKGSQVTVKKIPTDATEEIRMNLEKQLASQEDNTPASLKERVQFAENFGGEEFAKRELKAEAAAAVSRINFEKNYAVSDADAVAAEQTEMFKSGGAVE